MADSAITMKGVRKTYPFFALDDIALDLPAGHVMGFIGPNGAGKSTTIRILLGLVHQDQGDVQVLGHSMPAEQVAAKWDIGFASEDMRLYEVMSLAWHMRFIASIYSSWDAAYAETLLKRFDLRPEQKVRGLSHGQRVKASLLLVLARRPRLLVLDEPTTGLDPVARHEILRELVAAVQDEQRAALLYTDFRVAAPPVVPDGIVKSEMHGFRVEIVVDGIDPLPYSIAPLPDGQILVTEKTRALRMVSSDGALSEPIRGTPQVFNDGFEIPGIQLVYGSGYLLDVAPHPNYAENGWIYLSHTERCSDCNAMSRDTGLPVSMVALIRGRIEGGEWIDEETIWRTDIEHYSFIPDMAAGGRIAFDDEGHVFLTVGIKGTSEFDGIQDLTKPYGKIHRMNDDGTVPTDNPFVSTPNALGSLWTVGHRSPQGVEFDSETGRLWGTEMGQRGGDEINLLLPGRNYGWPLISKGMQYDGRPVDFGKELGIDFDPADLEQPVVDLTPSPAVSSFVIYTGDAFPGWRGNLLVGTLKATELYRMVIDGEEIVHRETLLDGLGRIRDIETGRDGFVYLLLEHASGSRILRLVPADI